MKPRQTRNTLTARTYNWGTMFEGSKADILKAGLAEPRHFPRALGKSGPDYRLPLDYSAKWRQANFGPNFGPMPASWESSIEQHAKGRYQVSVQFSPTSDLDIRHRVAQAMAFMRTLMALLRDIPPVPINEQLKIKARVRAD